MIFFSVDDLEKLCEWRFLEQKDYGKSFLFNFDLFDQQTASLSVVSDYDMSDRLPAMIIKSLSENLIFSMGKILVEYYLYVVGLGIFFLHRLFFLYS